MDKVFNFSDDWGMYIPEVKYLSPEPLVNYTNLALTEYPNVYFVGDALSTRASVHGSKVSCQLDKFCGLFRCLFFSQLTYINQHRSHHV